MTAGTVIVCILVGCVLISAIRSLIKGKKNGETLQCGGDCSKCGGHCH